MDRSSGARLVKTLGTCRVRWGSPRRARSWEQPPQSGDRHVSGLRRQREQQVQWLQGPAMSVWEDVSSRNLFLAPPPR